MIVRSSLGIFLLAQPGLLHFASWPLLGVAMKSRHG
jgi:hypothetical protein